ncbi:MAG TPA: hypothetical protein VJ768_09350, partial [Anaerolineales bacterium]|nr:hypothetical protein [Anaerolineales bacterium]
MDEPSVLDYFKSIVTPWRGPAPRIPPVEGEHAPQSAGDSLEGAAVSKSPREGATLAAVSGAGVISTGPGFPAAPAGAVLSGEQSEVVSEERSLAWPWRSGAALVLALLAQLALEPPDRNVTTGILFYSLSAAFLALAYYRKDWVIEAVRQPISRFLPLTARLPALILSLVAAGLAFLTFDENLFDSLNVGLWLVSILAFIWAFWEVGPAAARWPARFRAWAARPEWSLKISPWVLAMVAVAVLAIFFRLYQLEQV